MPGAPRLACHPARRLAAAVLAACASAVALPAAAAEDCRTLGLLPASRSVFELREARVAERAAQVFRDEAMTSWFIPLQGGPARTGYAGGPAVTGSGVVPSREACSFEGAVYWRLPNSDRALTVDDSRDVLTFLDLEGAAQVIDNRPAVPRVSGSTLDSLGVNYQLGLNYHDSAASSRVVPNVQTDFYGRYRDWYFSTSLGWNDFGRIARYESYALRESQDNGTFLRLGDSTTSFTALGEALQFAGASWGTDRTLRPSDFSPVLPSLRNGNALAGPVEVFINDNLQFQQTLQNGVYDLRNLPAQQGFNSYSVRTFDALGNLVTVQRDIYIPSTLLPPGRSLWRIDAGLQRQDFFTSNASYGSAVAAGYYALGLSDDSTVAVQGLASRPGSTVSATWDRRIAELWTGRAGVVAARGGGRSGQALQARIDGASRSWRFLLDWTRAVRPLPGLTLREPLEMQRLVQAQWNGIPDWTFVVTAAQSRREGQAREDVTSLSATTHVADASVNVSLNQVRSAAGKQDNLTVSVFLPLAPDDRRSAALYGSHSVVEGAQISRAQYLSSGQNLNDPSWSLGDTRDSRMGGQIVDGYWSVRTDRADLLVSGRASPMDRNLQLALRSGLLMTAGRVYATRPVNGAFAVVNTGQEGVKIFYENRSMGSTDASGLLLIPELRAMEINRLSVDPRSWPLQWSLPEIEQQVVPPRGAGVLVSFRINAKVWPGQVMVMPLDADGNRYPAGIVVTATAPDNEGDDIPRQSVVDRRGQVWLGELLPSPTFVIRHKGQRCEFSTADVVTEPPAGDNGPAPAAAPKPIKPLRCQETS